MGSSVIAAGDSAKALLACRVPLHIACRLSNSVRTVKHCKVRACLSAMTQTMLCTRKNLIITHDLQLDHFAVQLHGPDFLREPATGHQQELPAPTCKPQLSVTSKTYEVDANGGDVALSVRIVLRHNTAMVLPSSWAMKVLASSGPGKVPTANRSSKQDLPTPESPISRSCNTNIR